jgi:hypothetical protein
MVQMVAIRNQLDQFQYDKITFSGAETARRWSWSTPYDSRDGSLLSDPPAEVVRGPKVGTSHIGG